MTCKTVGKQSLQYRKDIDGLRALAILAVVFYHFGFLPAGFLGVDVFFVISGFLITGIVATWHADGSFSFRRFYLNRARRLVPAYVVVLGLSAIFAFALFTPPHLLGFAEALPWASLFLSNIHFLGQTDYFAQAAEFQPLLHTWSLAVEWQFYLIWPAVLFLGLRFLPKWLIYGCGIGALLVSVGMAELFKDSASSFYATPFRVFEFLIGAAAWTINQRMTFSRTTNTIGAGLGTIGVVLSLVWLGRFEQNPSALTLVPCLSVGALLVFRSGLTDRLLCLSPMVWIGKISYSLYLIHWPALVFARYATFDQLGQVGLLVLILICVLLAAASYIWVERPFRNTATRRSRVPDLGLAGLTTAAVAGLVGLGQLLSWNGGWVDRFPEDRIARSQSVIEAGQETIRANLADETPKAFRGDGGMKILVLGDSHAIDLAHALSRSERAVKQADLVQFRWDDVCYGERNKSFGAQLLERFRAVTPNTVCENETSALLESKLLANADIVILANAWTADTVPLIPQGLMKLNAVTDASVLIAGLKKLPFSPDVLFLLADEPSDLNRRMQSFDNRETEQINDGIRAHARAGNVGYLDLMDHICPDEAGACGVLGPNGEILFIDDNHWSRRGHTQYGPVIMTSLLEKLADSRVGRATGN